MHIPRGDTTHGQASTGSDPVEVVTLALFPGARRVQLPAACTLVYTAGHVQIGEGGACYRHDTTVDAGYVRTHPRTAFLDADGRGFRLGGRTVNIRQAGAIGDGRADDTAAIRDALALVEADGGGIVDIPPGAYRVTSPITLPPQTAMQGVGPSSVLQVEGCDGIVLAASDGIGPRVIRDFMIHGRGCEGFSAIVIDLAGAGRVQGVVFERLYLAFFGTGVRSRGLWHTTFRTITMNQVWNGLALNGRNVKITIDDCRITHGGLLRGSGESIGIRVGDATPAARPEDVQVSRSIVYGFDKAIVWRTALFGGVTHCDLDACIRGGLELVTADGGFTFANNWIQVEGSSAYGISCAALGYAPRLNNILLANNHIAIRKSSPGSCGIVIGNQQSDLTVEGNGISGPWEDGIRASGVRRLSVRDNKVESRIIIEHCTSVVVERNLAGAGIHLSANTEPASEP